MIRVLFPLLVLTLTSGCAESASRKIIAPEGADLTRPFSPGIRSGNFVFVSGAIGIEPGSTDIVGIQEQTRVNLENLGAVLKEAGLGFEDVVSANVFLADARHYDGMNEAFREVFPENPPARATVESAIVVPNALTEISFMAVDSDVRRTFIVPEGWPQPAAPFSWGVLAEDTLFLAGMVGVDPRSGEMAGGDLTSQAEQTFKNIGEVLEEAGMGFQDVVSARVYLADSREFGAMNDVFRSVFTKDPPARATVQARLANPALKIEVQCIAVKSSSRKVVGEVRPGSPFSPSIMAGDFLYLSGMVGRGPEGLPPGDVKAQTKQTLANLLSTLQAAGLGFEDVVEGAVFISDVRFYDAMNEAYQEAIPEAPPARATVGAPLMSPEALVEIQMIAKSR